METKGSVNGRIRPMVESNGNISLLRKGPLTENTYLNFTCCQIIIKCHLRCCGGDSVNKVLAKYALRLGFRLCNKIQTVRLEVPACNSEEPETVGALGPAD